MKRNNLFLQILEKIIIYLGLGLVKVLSFVPLSVGYLISDCLVSIFKRYDRLTETAKRNLRRSFPDLASGIINRICTEHMRCCIDYLFEFIRYDRLSEAKIRQRCVFHNIELLLKSFKDYDFIICYSGHFINYELATSLPLHLEGYGMCHLYLGGEHNVIQDWILSVRNRFGAINIPTTNPLRTIIKLNQSLKQSNSFAKGYVFGTLADMDTKEDNPHVASFFKHDFEVLTGSERIGRKYGMKFVFAEIIRPQRGYYEVTFKEIIPKVSPNEVPTAYTDEFVRMLEDNVRKQPEIWMLWSTPRF